MRYSNTVDTPLAERAALTTRENPWPLALLSQKIKDYVDRMPPVWVSGQVVQYNPRPTTRMAFFTIRDLNSEVSMSVKAFGNVISQAGSLFEEGAKVVVYAKPDFYEGNGNLSLFAKEVHTAGLGDLLAQIEQLRRRLEAEGLFDHRRKKPLPFLPKKVGLICGHGAKAEHDVIVNAQVRWPATRFEIREVAVQGQNCVREVSAAIAQLDALEDVEVIVVARGGGAVEDLLPFSSEEIVRAAAAANTPLVSAIGHETDTPLLDFVADYRASTPTDAARRIVPDVAEERQKVESALEQLRLMATNLVQNQRQHLQALRARPVMVRPAAIVEGEMERLQGAHARLTQAVHSRVQVSLAQLRGHRASLKALSPGATLERGYAILKTASGAVIRDATEVKKGDLLEAILGKGSLVAQVAGTSVKNKGGSK